MERCRDGRGVRRSVIAWWAKKTPPGLSEVRAGEIQRRAKSIVNAAGGAAGVIMGVCFVPIVMALDLAGIHLTWWHGLILGPLGWPICLVLMSRASRTVSRMVLTEGLCPSCAAPLVGQVPDAKDGCTVCPDCGAAWLVPVAHVAAAVG